MLSSKPKSVVLEASVCKTAPSSPRASKFGRAGALKTDPGTPSPKQASRLSLDHSPRSADHKPTPRISTPPDKQPRAIKRSEVQVQLAAAQEDLKKAKEQLASLEEEKIRLAEELKWAKKFADDANEKLQEALAAQRIAEEASEIDKFCADEMDQANIEATQKREEKWKEELKNVQNQHDLDVAALLKTTEELQRAKHDLSMTTEAKNSALRGKLKNLNFELHKVSTEVREAEERFLAKQVEVDDARSQIEFSKMTKEKTREDYEAALDKAKSEIGRVQNACESFEREFEQSKSDWHSKEFEYVSSLGRSKKEIALMNTEIHQMFQSHKGAELQAQSVKEGEAQLINVLKQLESEVTIAKKTAESAIDKSFQFKEMLLDKENELHSICQENNDLKIQEDTAMKKVEELSILLAEATMKKPVEDSPDNSILSLEPSETETNSVSQKAPEENPSEEKEADKRKSVESIGKTQDHSSKWTMKDENDKEDGKEEPLKLDGHVQQNGKMIDKVESADCDKSESLSSDFNMKIDVNANDLASGLLLKKAEIFPSKPQQLQKKKKAFMQRIWDLLKRKT